MHTITSFHRLYYIHDCSVKLRETRCGIKYKRACESICTLLIFFDMCFPSRSKQCASSQCTVLTPFRACMYSVAKFSQLHIMMLVLCSPMCQKWVTVLFFSSMFLCVIGLDVGVQSLLMMHRGRQLCEVHHGHIQSVRVCMCRFLCIQIVECAHANRLIMDCCQPTWWESYFVLKRSEKLLHRISF